MCAKTSVAFLSHLWGIKDNFPKLFAGSESSSGGKNHFLSHRYTFMIRTHLNETFMTTLYISLEKNKFSHSRSFPSIADQNDFF